MSQSSGATRSPTVPAMTSSAPVTACSSSRLMRRQLLAQHEALVLDVDDGEAGVDAGDAADAGQRQRAALHQLGLAVLGDVVGDDGDALGAMHEIHRAADGGHALGAGAPVGEIAVLGDLIGAEDRHIEMAAAHHGEAVGVVEERRARAEA